MPTLEITTMASCTVRCRYCPQDALAAAYPKDAAHRLSLADFQTVVDKLPACVRIDFSGFVEPWLNAQATSMLGYALAMGHSVAIYTTAQGMRDVDVVAGLLERHAAQVEVLCLHLPDAHGNMTGLRITPMWRQAVARLRQLRAVLRRYEEMTMSAAGELDEQPLPAERLLPWVGHDRAGSLDRGQIGAQAVERAVRHEGVVGCSFTPFYDQNVLLPNGDVVLCCMDYGLERRLGNLLEQDYFEIFAGAAMARLRADNMQVGAERSLCKRCNRAVRYVAPEGARQMWKEDTRP